jgi:hypothetical protein
VWSQMEILAVPIVLWENKIVCIICWAGLVQFCSWCEVILMYLTQIWCHNSIRLDSDQICKSLVHMTTCCDIAWWQQACSNLYGTHRKKEQLVTNLETSCYKSVFTSCRQVVFALLVPSLEQAVNNLEQAWWHYQTCYKVVLTSLIQSW